MADGKDSTDSEGLRDAFLDYAREALAYYAATYGNPAIIEEPAWWPRWVRVEPDLFQANPTEPSWPDGDWRDRGDALASLPAFHALRDRLQANPWTESQIDSLVGTARGRTRLELSSLLYSELLRPGIVETGGFAYDPDEHGPRADAIVAALLAHDVPETWVVPLLGFIGPSGAFELADGFIIRLLTDEEVSLGMNLGVLADRTDFGNRHLRRLSESDQWCLALSHLVPKLTGDSVVDPFPEPPIAEAADRFTLAVRLAAGGSVVRGPRAAFQFRSPLHARQGGQFENRWVLRPQPVTPAVVARAAVPELLELWADLGKSAVVKDKPLQVALRRLHDAGLRDNAVDMLIDLMIAAEALFLTGDAETRGELSFRLSMHAALFVDLAGHSADNVRRLMNEAYRARSRVVHGTVVKTPKALGGEVSDLASMIRDLELIMRLALQKATRLVAGGHSKELHAWDERIAAALEDGAKLEEK